ncbi:MAG: hypothetical protein K9J37_14975 [Saprospiraceae bacterium]|nr:hypothetical protein [Saprospiraceae bacterium]MCF8251212.1 hypothetical protein [Saprospiraceae bacterium]MCF8281196.1 hypothetical protein [Bacteroidales bacterium]MCF8313164.1 hypothetical protein [Saprospiraceae bacterium]MCF8441574.1 hypothetical protein [Saprospiraceae bacterium]
MRISDKRLLKELQAEFRSDFPFLEMEFYKPDDLQAVSLIFEPGLRVSDVRSGGSDGMLVLNGNLRCAAIEQTMADVFGLQMNVSYRKGIYGHFNAKGKTLTELNYHAMHMAEAVTIV